MVKLSLPPKDCFLAVQKEEITFADGIKDAVIKKISRHKFQK